MAFLKHKRRVADSVRLLTLQQDDRSDWHAMDIRATKPEMLFLILSQLPSLRHLELINIYVPKEGEEKYQATLELVVDRHLDRLSINFDDASYYGHTMPPESIVRFLSLFRSVDALSMFGVHIDHDETAGDDDITGSLLPLHTLNFKHLEIRHVYPLGPLVAMMQSRSLLRSVETLQMDTTEYHGENVDALGILLDEVSSSLVHLALPTSRLHL